MFFCFFTADFDCSRRQLFTKVMLSVLFIYFIRIINHIYYLLFCNISFHDSCLGMFCKYYIHCIFWNKISDLLILLSFNGLSNSSRDILKLKVLAIFSAVFGMNGLMRIAMFFIAVHNSYRTLASLVSQGFFS